MDLCRDMTKFTPQSHVCMFGNLFSSRLTRSPQNIAFIISSEKQSDYDSSMFLVQSDRFGFHIRLNKKSLHYKLNCLLLDTNCQQPIRNQHLCLKGQCTQNPKMKSGAPSAIRCASRSPRRSPQGM